MKNSHPLYRLNTTHWHVERLVFLIAGALVAICSLLGFIIHPSFHFAALFVGGMLMFFALTGYCPMAILIARWYPGSTLQHKCHHPSSPK